MSAVTRPLGPEVTAATLARPAHGIGALAGSSPVAVGFGLLQDAAHADRLPEVPASPDLYSGDRPSSVRTAACRWRSPERPTAVHSRDSRRWRSRHRSGTDGPRAGTPAVGDRGVPVARDEQGDRPCRGVPRPDRRIPADPRDWARAAWGRSSRPRTRPRPQRVAIKLIGRDYVSSAEAVERFRQEGRLASAVTHPRCVFVLAADEHEGRPYIVMELMPGDDAPDAGGEGRRRSTRRGRSPRSST